jgi:hypothetical protein
MDLGQIQTDLTAWLNVTALDALDAPLPVIYTEEPHKVYTGPSVRVELATITKQGHDLPQYTHDALTDEYVERMWGVRRMRVRLTFRSFDQRWGGNARRFAESWRINTQATDSIGALGEAGLALRETGELINNDVVWGNRLMSQVETDVTFGLWGYESRVRADGGYLQTVHFEGQNYLLDIDGNPIEDALGNPVVDLDIREFSVDGRIEP